MNSLADYYEDGTLADALFKRPPIDDTADIERIRSHHEWKWRSWIDLFIWCTVVFFAVFASVVYRMNHGWRGGLLTALFLVLALFVGISYLVGRAAREPRFRYRTVGANQVVMLPRTLTRTRAALKSGHKYALIEHPLIIDLDPFAVDFEIHRGGNVVEVRYWFRPDRNDLPTYIRFCGSHDNKAFFRSNRLRDELDPSVDHEPGLAKIAAAYGLEFGKREATVVGPIPKPAVPPRPRTKEDDLYDAMNAFLRRAKTEAEIDRRMKQFFQENEMSPALRRRLQNEWVQSRFPQNSSDDGPKSGNMGDML